MKEYINLYDVLQVSQKAEIEVIKAAYRRLCKKYHPDNVDHGCDEKIKLINHAYAILGSAENRRAYDIDSLGLKQDEMGYEYEHNREVQKARRALAKYFSHISKGELLMAYGYLSKEDKKNILKDDFLEWQDAVRNIYEIIDFEINTVKSNIESFNTGLNKFEFEVSLTEKQRKSTMIEDVRVYRSVVFEDGHYKVILGYQSVKELASNFKLQKDKTEAEEFEYDRKSLIKEVSKEIIRSKRYKRNFSIALLEFREYRFVHLNNEDNIGMFILLLKQKLRICDIVGRLSKNRILVILPETTFGGAKAVMKKVGVALKKYDVFVKNGIVQYNGESVQEMIDRVISVIL